MGIILIAQHTVIFLALKEALRKKHRMLLRQRQFKV